MSVAAGSPAGSPGQVRHLATILALGMALAACGGLETPDLAHGEVAGRLVGAAPGASAYPLGAPERKVLLAPDGTFRLGGLPAGTARLVLFDGGLRAEVVAVEVTGAGRTRVERRADSMPLAGRLVMTVVPDGGVAAVGPRYQVRGTDQAGVARVGGSAVLFPLPEGAYDLETSMDGFQAASDGVAVTSGLTGGVEVRLRVALSGTLGCAAIGEACRNDLRCDPADGRCYACRLDRDDCEAGATCDPETRFCALSPGPAAAPVCSACADDAACGGAALGAYCEKRPGALTGYCSRRDACPAGFARDETDPAAPRCYALLGCHTYFEEFGEECFSTATCDERDGLAGGRCHGADFEAGRPGLCTAPCALDADCIVAGFTCDPALRVCVRAAG